MSKTRREIAEGWAAAIERSGGLSLTDPARITAAELRALWAREKLLEALVEALERVQEHVRHASIPWPGMAAGPDERAVNSKYLLKDISDALAPLKDKL